MGTGVGVAEGGQTPRRQWTFIHSAEPGAGATRGTFWTAGKFRDPCLAIVAGPVAAR